MCGVVGFCDIRNSGDAASARSIAKIMNEALSARGPDGSGIWRDPDHEHTLVLAHRRLAVLDLSSEGAQPMVSASGRYVISFNGEIYSHLELRRELKAAGIQFRGSSDTEVMLAAIEHWGLDRALPRLNGMFAFALWDRRERRLHLVRDRLGKKPLYVGWAGEVLVFGSELKALRAHPKFRPTIDRGALLHYMRYAHVPAPACIYQGVWALPAGHRIDLQVGRLEPGQDLEARMVPYWSHLDVFEAQRERGGVLSEREMVEQFEALLGRCVQERLVSDVPLGAFLSGGVDSSTIVALMQKHSDVPVRTYTIGFDEAGYDEARHAKQVAAHLGTEHHEQVVSAQDALDVIPRLPTIYDEPFADISQIPTYLVSRFARDDVTVVLSGDGGDEMLGGYNRHAIAPRLWQGMRLAPAPLRRVLGRSLERVSTSRWDALRPDHPQFGDRMHKIASVVGLGSPEAVYNRLVSHWNAPEQLVVDPVETSCPLVDPAFQPRAEGPNAASFAERMMYWDTLSYLPNGILTKVDRASMAVGLEARAPLLDPRIYEFAWTLPERAKIRNRRGKWLLRQVLERHVPAKLFRRPKQGFAVPVGEWLRGPLRDWAEDLLDESRLDADGLLYTSLIRRTWAEHLEARGRHGDKLWTVLMFQAWKREWM